jgi:hypothetical protein
MARLLKLRRQGQLPLAVLLALLVACGLALTTGCTTKLEANKLTKWSSETALNSGIVYFLPAADFEVILVRELKGCSFNGIANAWEAKIAISSEVKVNYKADPGATYLVDYGKLDKAMKQTDLRIDLYENGTLKGINAGFADFTAQVLEKTLGTALNLVAAATGLKIPTLASYKILSSPSECPSENPCLPMVQIALDEIPKLRSKVMVLRKSIAESEDRIKLTLSNDIGYDVEEVLKEQKMVAGNLAQIDRNQKQIAYYKSLLTNRQVLKFRPTSSTLYTVGSGHESIEKWFNIDILQNSCSLARFREAAAVTFNLFGFSNGGGTGSGNGELKPGLIYRQPLQANWAVCRGNQSEKCGDSLTGNLLDSGVTTVPQLGVMISLPLESDVFEDQTLKAQFHPDGSLEFVEFADKASAVRASQAFAASAGSLAQYLSARRQEDKTKAQDEAARLTAEKEKIEAELALAEAKKKLEEYRAAQEGD